MANSTFGNTREFSLLARLAINMRLVTILEDHFADWPLGEKTAKRSRMQTSNVQNHSFWCFHQSMKGTRAEKVPDQANTNKSAEKGSTSFADKKLPQFKEPGLRNVKTTSVFRAVNFELYAKPVSLRRWQGKSCDFHFRHESHRTCCTQTVLQNVESSEWV